MNNNGSIKQESQVSSYSIKCSQGDVITHNNLGEFVTEFYAHHRHNDQDLIAIREYLNRFSEQDEPSDVTIESSQQLKHCFTCSQKHNVASNNLTEFITTCFEKHQHTAQDLLEIRTYLNRLTESTVSQEIPPSIAIKREEATSENTTTNNTESNRSIDSARIETAVNGNSNDVLENSVTTVENTEPNNPQTESSPIAAELGYVSEPESPTINKETQQHSNTKNTLQSDDERSNVENESRTNHTSKKANIQDDSDYYDSDNNSEDSDSLPLERSIRIIRKNTQFHTNQIDTAAPNNETTAPLGLNSIEEVSTAPSLYLEKINWPNIRSRYYKACCAVEGCKNKNVHTTSIIYNLNDNLLHHLQRVHPTIPKKDLSRYVETAVKNTTFCNDLFFYCKRCKYESTKGFFTLEEMHSVVRNHPCFGNPTLKDVIKHPERYMRVQKARVPIPGFTIQNDQYIFHPTDFLNPEDINLENIQKRSYKVLCPFNECKYPHDCKTRSSLSDTLSKHMRRKHSDHSKNDRDNYVSQILDEIATTEDVYGYCKKCGHTTIKGYFTIEEIRKYGLHDHKCLTKLTMEQLKKNPKDYIKVLRAKEPIAGFTIENDQYSFDSTKFATVNISFATHQSTTTTTLNNAESQGNSNIVSHVETQSKDNPTIMTSPDSNIELERLELNVFAEINSNMTKNLPQPSLNNAQNSNSSITISNNNNQNNLELLALASTLLSTKTSPKRKRSSKEKNPSRSKRKKTFNSNSQPETIPTINE